MGRSLASMLEAVPLGKTDSTDFGSLQVQRYRFFYQGRVNPFKASCYSGNQLKASYSVSRNSSTDLESATRRLLVGSSSGTSEINGQFNRSTARKGYILDYYDDEYGGVIINSERLPWDANDFGFILHLSLRHWKSKGKNGVWLKLPIDRSELVPIAVKEGFKYHHAEQEYVMLTYWIPEGPSLLPSNASHQVGVGGIAINEKKEVLVVQEKYCSLACGGAWKLPTGFINESEEIFDGVVREVKEETGIETEFQEVIAFRHAHCVAFKKSDLFFVCMLRPLSAQIKIDGTEIQAAKWMPLGEFMEQPFVQGDDMFKRIIDIFIARCENRYCGLAAHGVISKFDGKYSSLYYNILEENCKVDCL